MEKQEEYFTEAEAQAKVRMRVKTIAKIEGIPLGTRGTVVRTEYLFTKKGYCVIVRWNLKLPPGQKKKGSVSYQEDWFTKTMYDELLTEEVKL